MTRHILFALAAAIGLGVAAPAAEPAPRDGIHQTAAARVKCYGPYPEWKAEQMVERLLKAGYDAWMKRGSGGWYVCVKY